MTDPLAPDLLTLSALLAQIDATIANLQALIGEMARERDRLAARVKATEGSRKEGD